VDYFPKVHFENARALSESKEDSQLRYCCLELRYCIEAIVYKKLSAFRDIPNTITETWQPHKAIKMLSKIDEFADKYCKVEINFCQSNIPPIDGWIALGEQKIPSVQWLTKNYSKLGSFLHLPKPNESESFNTEKIKKCVIDVLYGVEQYVNTDIWIRASGIELQACLECSEDLIFDRNQLKEGDVVECDSCKFRYRVKSKGGNKLTLSYTVHDVKCGRCGEMLQIDDQKIMKNREFVCGFCGEDHVVVQAYRRSSQT
jgi:DNA-directed RNA polymerase subunit RPC12/RpoP